MDYKTKKKLMAIGKITLGGARMASGAATMLGHGLLASYVRSPTNRSLIGRYSIAAGHEMLKHGLEELQQARNI